MSYTVGVQLQVIYLLYSVLRRFLRPDSVGKAPHAKPKHKPPSMSTRFLTFGRFEAHMKEPRRRPLW